MSDNESILMHKFTQKCLNDVSELSHIVDDFVDQVHAIEVVKCSLDEIQTFTSHLLSRVQLSSIQSAQSFAVEVRDFLINEAACTWGLKFSDLKAKLAPRRLDYLGMLATDDGPSETSREFIQGWLRVNSVLSPLPE